MTTTTAGLDADALIAAAREQTGLTDLGDDAILEGLHVLTDAINREAKLTEAAQGRWAQQITATLANRLQVEDYLAKHPALLDAPVEKPLFVFGLPRTGTTLTINLLNADPARRSLLRWEAFNSVPPAAKGALSSDPRYVAEQARLDMMLKYAPHISAMHQKRLFQLLQENEGGQWTLKNPWHPLFLNDLTTVYPDAQLVMTHRDPADVVASACSLVYQVRKMFSDDVDPVEVGKSQLRTFDLMIERMLAYREKHGADSIHDIQYDAQVRDPIGTMKRLYARFDTELTAEAESAMQAMLDANPQGKHGKHSYDLADYGLDRAGIHAHFKDYTERFGIKCKA